MLGSVTDRIVVLLVIFETFDNFRFLGVERKHTKLAIEVDILSLISREIRAETERAEVRISSGQFAVHRFSCEL